MENFSVGKIIGDEKAFFMELAKAFGVYGSPCAFNGLSNFLKSSTEFMVYYDFGRIGDSIARAYWSDGFHGGCIGVYLPEYTKYSK